MAKTRYVNTRFWTDGYVLKLSIEEKLLFLYLLTNQHTELCGAYEIPESLICFETGMERGRLRKALEGFERDKKIVRFLDWIYLPNFVKHQAVNPNIQKAIDRTLLELPIELMEKVKASEGVRKASEALPKATQLKLEPKLKLQPQLEPQLEREEDVPPEPQVPTPREITKAFFEDKDKQEKIIEWMATKGVEEHAARKELEAFISYWTEKNSTGKKERWEMEKTFEVERRLRTWIERATKNNRPSGKQTQWHIAQ